jgi:hypothetical protein
MNRNRIPLKNKSNNLLQNHQLHLQPGRMLMGAKTLKVMQPTGSKMIRSTQSGLRRKEMKKRKKGLNQKLRAFTLRISIWIPVLLNQNQVF